jgi:hypothetical protein
MKRLLILSACYILLICGEASAQIDSSEVVVINRFQSYDLPYFTYGKGLGIISPDSLYMLNIRFRMQNRFGFTYDGNDISSVEARVRRLRLRFDGFIYHPKITYAIQLSFTSGDISDFVEDAPPNILRDAMVYYQPDEHWTFGFGQTKLPGNRQRVNSSGDLQLVDRSIANAVFNIDRDFGFQAVYENTDESGFKYIFRGAISSGEGRNWIVSSGDGLSYTVRAEFLPFGAFKNNGAYFEGDLLFEEDPKLAVGLVYNFNHHAKRTAGQRGELLYDQRDIRNLMADFIFKYRGLAIEGGAMERYTDDPVTTAREQEPEVRHVYNGYGTMLQASYTFRSMFEFVSRFSQVTPYEAIQEYDPLRTSEYTIGVNKYLRFHRLKLQFDATYVDEQSMISELNDNFWNFRFQIELGI